MSVVTSAYEYGNMRAVSDGQLALHAQTVPVTTTAGKDYYEIWGEVTATSDGSPTTLYIYEDNVIVVPSLTVTVAPGEQFALYRIPHPGNDVDVTLYVDIKAATFVATLAECTVINS